MITYHDIKQGSIEWFKLRERKKTASHATAIGANGKGLKTYCQDIVIDMVRIKKPESYTNTDIERGSELEPIAVSAYEFQNGVKIIPMGFITNDKYPNVGVSPDGLIGDDGGIEIKARNDKKHFALIQGETSEIPFNQIQMTLLVTERKWWDFGSFNDNFDKPLFIKRIYPDEKYFEKLKKGFEEGEKLIEEYLETYKNF
jgi:hypothetical protein